MFKKSLKSASTFALLFSAACGPALAQATPAASPATQYSGFQLPDIGGSLRYSLTGSESIIFGYNGQPGTGINTQTSVSGNLAYLSKSQNSPFSAVYSGGYSFGNGSEPSYPFQNLSLSQQAKTGRWTFILADSISYLPQTPTTGLSGIPGVGDLGVPPVGVGANALGILTLYETRINNVASGTVTNQITASTSVSATGSYGIQRFIGTNAQGIDNNQVSASGTLSHRLDARSSLSGNYGYSSSSFLNNNSLGTPSFSTQSINLEYSRQLSHFFSIDLAAGPQRVSNGSGTLISSSSTSVSANASANYAARVYTSALSYSRGVTTGNGIVVGAHTDAINFTIQRRIGPALHVSGTAGYNRSTQLPNSTLPSFSSSAVVAGAQASRAIIPDLSAFVSYTLQHQIFTGNNSAINPFNGTSQVIGIGLTYSPRPLLGR